MADFTYRDDGVFTSIMPETPQAVEAWNTVIAPQTDDTGKVLSIHFPSVKAQLEAAGYSVRKAAKIKGSDDDLLDSLLS